MKVSQLREFGDLVWWWIYGGFVVVFGGFWLEKYFVNQIKDVI